MCWSCSTARRSRSWTLGRNGASSARFTTAHLCGARHEFGQPSFRALAAGAQLRQAFATSGATALMRWLVLRPAGAGGDHAGPRVGPAHIDVLTAVRPLWAKATIPTSPSSSNSPGAARAAGVSGRWESRGHGCHAPGAGAESVGRSVPAGPGLEAPPGWRARDCVTRRRRVGRSGVRVCSRPSPRLRCFIAWHSSRAACWIPASFSWPVSWWACSVVP